MIVGNTIEQALTDDQIISDAFGTPSSAEDYSYCPQCQRVRWLGTCVECDFPASTEEQ